MTCKTHKNYRGIRRPNRGCQCLKCKLIFIVRCVRKKLGLKVEQIRRKTKITFTGPALAACEDELADANRRADEAESNRNE